MKVLVACEESQTVCKAFRELGHEAYSCDEQECSGGRPEWHYKQDVRDVLMLKWDLIIAHPPCTRLCNSGVRWLHERHLWLELIDAIRFFNSFKTGRRYCIENPIPHCYARDGFYYGCGDDEERIEGIGSPTQIIQPYQFGHGERKATGLWLHGPERTKLRAKTFPGIARARLPKLKWSAETTMFEKQTVVAGREQRIWKMAPSPG